MTRLPHWVQNCTPGVTGFVPFQRKPSELVGIRCLQAMLWVHFYRLGEYATDPFRRHASINAMVIELVVDLLPKILFLLLWALWIVPVSRHRHRHRHRARSVASAPPAHPVARRPPLTANGCLLWQGMLEVFSLPPFLDDLEHSLLLHTLRAYPRGLPADGLLIEPEERPSASADGSRVPRPGMCRLTSARPHHRRSRRLRACLVIDVACASARSVMRSLLLVGHGVRGAQGAASSGRRLQMDRLARDAVVALRLVRALQQGAFDRLMRFHMHR